MTPNHETLLGHLAFVARQIAHDKKIQDSGYRTVINTGPDAGQLCSTSTVLLGARNGLATGIVSPPVPRRLCTEFDMESAIPGRSGHSPSGLGSVSPIPSLLGLDGLILGV